ncbi:arsenate reductase ArsC [Sporichthya sp.]|uniref:arsenate reductase ArsC n=1 Tax=Sporichthya sp. TaxID=65475 RepID=UPI00183F2E5F|nr:arsenate reductase ArsC [Sporichthya sp.]MBA3744557.1 arsenate reductase ArsC [Sporichthya sp.]
MAPTTHNLADPNTEGLLLRIADQLAKRFAGVFAAETVERYVFESYTTLLRTAKIRTYVPILAEHFATDRLTALAQAKGAITKRVPEVLFVCVHNAGRSQMAAALLRHHGGGRVHVRSAGSLPAGELEPVVVAAITEIGLELSDGEAPAYPKPLTDDVVQAADVVITMGCGDACPVYPGKRYLDWDLADPAGRPLAEVRAIRDDIDARVRWLLNEIAPGPTP